MKTITVRINKDGSEVKVEADGFTGKSCTNATKDLLAKLGQEVDSHKKDEYYQEGTLFESSLL